MSGATMTALAATDEEQQLTMSMRLSASVAAIAKGNCSMVATVREGKMVNIRSTRTFRTPPTSAFACAVSATRTACTISTVFCIP